MNRIIYITALLAVSFLHLSMTAAHPPIEPKDTVIIELDNNTRIIIYTKDAQGIKELQQYDINAMLKDLSMSIDSSESEVQQLVIEDENGDRYLADTTIVLENDIEVLHGDESPQEIKIRLGNYRITAEADDWDELEEEFEEWEDGPEFKTETRMEEGPKSYNSFDIEIGTNNYFEDGGSSFPDSDAPYSVRPWGSWYVSLGWSRTSAIAGPLYFEYGSSFSWYNWKFEDAQYSLEKGPEMVEFIRLPSEVNGKKSKLTASHINVSFVPIFDFSRGERKVKSWEAPGVKIENYKQRGFRIGVGMYAGYRLGSHTKIKFRQDGDTDKDKDHSNFYMSSWRYGLRLRVGIRSVDLFANYDLNEVFNSGRGPELNAFSFGIIL